MRSATEIKRGTRRAGLLYLAAATARNILAPEQLYRTGILIDIAGQLLFIAAVLALYRLFEDVELAFIGAKPRAAGA